MTGSKPMVHCFSHPREFDASLLALFEKAERDDIELGAHWFANLIDTVFPAQGAAVFFVLEQKGAPVVALALRREWRRTGLVLHSLTNFYSSRWRPLLAAGAGAHELATLLREIRLRERALIGLQLDALDVQDRSLLQQSLHLSGYWSHAHFRFKNWTLRAPASWRTYLGSRKGKLRSDLKRMHSRLLAQGGGLSIHVGQSVEDTNTALADFQRVYDQSWKKAEPFVDFVPGLVKLAARRGWLRLGCVHLDGKAIASQIWLVNAGRASIFKVAYDEAYSAYSPGTLCTALLMEHVIEKDAVRDVDYLIGDDRYKRNWMDQCRDREALSCFNWRHPAGLLAGLREALVDRLRPLLKHLPRRV